MTVAPPGGTTLIIINDPDIVQTLHYVNADDFPADCHEQGLDRLTKIASGCRIASTAPSAPPTTRRKTKSPTPTRWSIWSRRRRRRQTSPLHPPMRLPIVPLLRQTAPGQSAER